MQRHRLFCGLLSLSTVSCGAGWHRPDLVVPGIWPPRQQVQVWADSQMRRWHGVVVHGDSISGVPYVRALDCDSCRRALPLDRVDSMRVGNPEAGFLKTLGLVVGLPALFLVIICSTGEGGPPCSEGT
jgi:hypothetical protein